MPPESLRGQKTANEKKNYVHLPLRRIDFWTLFFKPVLRYSNSHSLVICTTLYLRGYVLQKENNTIITVTAACR